MQNEALIKELEAKAEKSMKEFSESTRTSLEQAKIILDEREKDAINIYSNEIRNLAIISGTIAPFSLTLLGIEKLNTNSAMLLAGFLLLIFNIIFAQLSLREKLLKYDKKITNAKIEYVFAQGYQMMIDDESKKAVEKTSVISDYLESLKNIDLNLGLNQHISLDPKETREVLRTYNNLATIVFSGGAVAIALSVVLNPILAWSVGLF